MFQISTGQGISTNWETLSNFFVFLYSTHRCDSSQGTGYITNPFFLTTDYITNPGNFLQFARFLATTIENLRWQFGGDIVRVTFGKFYNIIGSKT